MPELVDIDLDALAPKDKRVKLGGKVYRLPGDMPMGLFFRVQSFEQRVDAGEDETVMLSELRDELLALFQVRQPTMKALPDIGILVLLGALGAIYSGGGSLGEQAAQATTARSKRKTPSNQPPRTRRATSR